MMIQMPQTRPALAPVDSDLPAGTDRLYAALLARDPAYEGRAFVGVRTTGIFCRLTCPARKPKRENCDWFASASAARAAGFRPCRRCFPQGVEAECDPLIAHVTAAVEADPGRRWSEADVIAMGYDPSTLRRAFRRHFGQTFLQYARQKRLGHAVSALKRGDPMIEAQLDAGFDSASGFRAAFARLFGHAPHEMTDNSVLCADILDTELGAMIAIADHEALHLLEFTDRKALPRQLRALSAAVGGRIGLARNPVIDRAEAELTRFFAGEGAAFTLPLAMHGTDFQRQVWTALRTIPAGQTRSYGALAAEIGRPTATRAVANANARNPLAIIVPCHRVIGADGTLTGYAGGLWRKQKLIALENAYGNASESA